MAEGGGPSLEDQLVAKLIDIFPDHHERIIRESVYSVMVNLDGQGLPEDIILNHCIDGLIQAGTPPLQAGPKRCVDTPHPKFDETKRIRPNATQDSTMIFNDLSVTPGRDSVGSNMNELVNTSADDRDESIGNMSAMQIDNDQVQARMRRQKDEHMITDMFPWVQLQWVSEQLDKPNLTVEAVINAIIDNPTVVPKKEKPRPVPNPPPPTDSAVAATSSQQAEKTTKDYLNDYHEPKMHSFNFTVQYLSDRFPWLYAESIRQVLKQYNGHYAPTFHALYTATKDINYQTVRQSHSGFILAKIAKPGQPDLTTPLRVLKGRRPSLVGPKRQLPPDQIEEAAWIEAKLNLDPSEQVLAWIEAKKNLVPTEQQAAASEPDLAQASQSAEKLDYHRESELEMARQRGEIFECEICYGEYIITKDMVACSDGHLFCADCLRQHAKEAIYGQAKTDLICMNEDCDARFLHDMVLKALDPDNVKKLDERRMYEALNSADIEGLERCKYCDYSVVIDVPPTVNKVFQCGKPDCGKEFCRLCKVDWEEHVGKPCREVETEDDTCKRREAEERMAEAVIRRCHKCKVPLVKSDGCNKLICSCGGMICYICRQPITGYEHFCRHVRDPGQKCKLCKNCYLWEDANAKDTEAVSKIQEEANKNLAESGKILKIGVDLPPKAPNAAAAARAPNGQVVQRQQQDVQIVNVVRQRNVQAIDGAPRNPNHVLAQDLPRRQQQPVQGANIVRQHNLPAANDGPRNADAPFHNLPYAPPRLFRNYQNRYQPQVGDFPLYNPPAVVFRGFNPPNLPLYEPIFRPVYQDNAGQIYQPARRLQQPNIQRDANPQGVVQPPVVPANVGPQNQAAAANRNLAPPAAGPLPAFGYGNGFGAF